VTSPAIRTYLLAVGGSLLGVERVIGLLRRRRVDVVWLSLQSGERAGHSRILLRVSSANHDQVRRQLARLIEITTQTDLEEEFRDDGT
jgi:acetolactate synthase small subunit